MAILVTAEMEPDKLEDFAEVLTAAAGAKPLAVKARIKKVLKEQRERQS